MVIQITNKCTMMCPHCMQDSNPNGETMDMKTFKRAIDFAVYLKDIFISISGGEPTMVDNLKEYWDYADKTINKEAVMTLVSNGSFITDRNKVNLVDKMLFGTMRKTVLQITSIKGLYSNYNLIHKYKKNIELKYKHHAVVVDDVIANMKVLGRAERNMDNPNVSKFINNKYSMSCSNHVLLCHQVSNTEEYRNAVLSNWTIAACMPFIAWNGDLKLGESVFCGTVININEHTNEEIFDAITKFKPCGKCLDYKNRFINRNDPDILRAKFIIGL